MWIFVLNLYEALFNCYEPVNKKAKVVVIHLLNRDIIREMNKFQLLFFDGTVITELIIRYGCIYLFMNH